MELDPLSLASNSSLGSAFTVARQYDQAIEQLRKTSELASELAPTYIPVHWDLGRAFVHKSMYTEAVVEFEKALVMSPGNTLLISGLGYAYAVAGRRLEAQKVLDKLNELSKQKYVPALYRAGIYAGLGEKDKAFEWLEKSYADRSIGVGLEAPKESPTFDPLRSDPRFTDLLRRMNLQP